MSELVAVILLLAGLAIYFLPLLIANARNHHQLGLIFFINLIIGWTGIGWLATLFWAAVSRPQRIDGISPETHVRCPECQELILKGARVCKHCGTRLVPQ
jgi:hypothetical protein